MKELQERNEQIIQQNQEENGEVLSENIPRETLEQAGVEEQKGEEEEEEEEEEKEEDELEDEEDAQEKIYQSLTPT